MTPGLWGRPVHGPAGPAVSRAAGGRPLSAYSIAGARRLDMTSFLGMSALTRGGMPHVVEPAGFEPATFPLRTGRPATGRRPRSAPDPIRTGDTRIRNPVLCPLSYKGVHPPCDDMRPRTGGRIRGGSWRWRGRGRENKRRKNPSRMPSFPRAYSVACGRRSRHEPLRAPGRTRSGDLPLTRRTLCLLSYRGGCRKPPAVRRRPHALVTGHGGGHAVVRPEGRAVYAARAGAGPPSGSAPGPVVPARIRRFARHGGVEPPSTVLETVGLPLSQWRVHVFRSSVFKSRRRPSVRWHATVCVPGRGDPLCGPRMHSGARVCIRMHPGMHTVSLPVSACFQRSRSGPEACMHCMHHSPIEDSRKRKETPYIDAYNAYKRKELFLFPLFIRVFGPFPKPFLYASPDAYKCIHAYETGRKTLQYCKVRRRGFTIL